MRKDKYYGTCIMLRVSDEFIEKYGKLIHHQYRIVCKAKSMAEANRKAEALGLGNKTFNRDYTSETGNEIQIKMCDKYGFIICTTGTLGNDYVDIREAL